MKYALLSVTDKTGLYEFAHKLRELGYSLLATSGTTHYLRDKGIDVDELTKFTGYTELLHGKVKSLHPKVFAAILASADELTQLDTPPIDLVVVNLYKFEDNPSPDNIDIGGVALIRAAAKNYPRVTVIVDPQDYDWIADKLATNSLTIDDRRMLAHKAFRYTTWYDGMIASYFDPNFKPLLLYKHQTLRYGENPHQPATWYKIVDTKGFALHKIHKLQGKDLSFNNLLDIDTAIRVIKWFANPTAVTIKHTTVAALASGTTIEEAFDLTYKGDPMSIFGGILGFNRPVTKQLAERLTSIFIEVVVAPEFTDTALTVLGKKKKLILIKLPADELPDFEYRTVTGDVLVQAMDRFDTEGWQVVGKYEPTESELAAAKFAFQVVQFVKSNAIVLATPHMTVGIGGGQPSRVWAAELAIKNRDRFNLTHLHPVALASDGFLPFPDTVELAAQAGIDVIVEPGGSIRDPEVIATANRYKIPIIFTHKRHFRH